MLDEISYSGGKQTSANANGTGTADRASRKPLHPEKAGRSALVSGKQGRGSDLRDNRLYQAWRHRGPPGLFTLLSQASGMALASSELPCRIADPR